MTVIVILCTLISVLFGYLARTELKDGNKTGFALMLCLQVIAVACVFLAIFSPV